MSRATLVNDEVVEPTEAETTDMFGRLKSHNLKNQMMTFLRSIVARALKICQMHQEAEEVFQKHSAEVGETRKEVTELRSVVDNYIQKELTNQAPQQEKVDDSEDVDFFVDPVKAVDSRINNHPKIKEAEQITDNYRKQTALSQLQARHPDMEEILNDSKFAEWVQQSIRTKLAAQADQLYDVEAANELFSLYKREIVW